MKSDFESSGARDHSPRSFRPSDYGLSDVPWILIGLVVAAAVLAGLGYVFDQVGLLLPPDVRLVVIGFSVGLLAGLGIAGRGREHTQPDQPVSERVKQIARDPHRKIEAIKIYREETGAGLAQAKDAVESFIRNQ